MLRIEMSIRRPIMQILDTCEGIEVRRVRCIGSLTFSKPSLKRDWLLDRKATDPHIQDTECCISWA